MESTRTKCTDDLDCSCIDCTYAQKKCFVFILPPDVVNRIYGLVLYERKAERFDHSVALLPDELRFQRNPRGPSCLSILQTCRRINDEAAGIFYAHHPLYFRDSTIIEPQQDTKLTTFLQLAHHPFYSVQWDINKKNYYLKLTAFQRFLQVTSTPRLENVTRLTLNVEKLKTAFQRTSDLGKLKGLKELKVVFFGEDLPDNCHKILPRIIQNRCKYWVEQLKTLESLQFSFDSWNMVEAEAQDFLQRIPELEAEIQKILRERREKKLKTRQR